MLSPIKVTTEQGPIRKGVYYELREYIGEQTPAEVELEIFLKRKKEKEPYRIFLERLKSKEEAIRIIRSMMN